MLSNVRWNLIILSVSCILLLIVPLFIRNHYSDGLLIDGESYKNLRLAKEFRENGFIFHDSLSYGGRVFIGEQMWIILLSLSPDFFAKYLSILFGFLSFIFFYLILESINPKIVNFSSLLLIISPSFLYIFSTATKYTAVIFFILLGFYFYINKKEIFCYTSFFIAGFFSVFSLFLVVLIFFYNSLKQKKYRPFFILFSGLLLLFLVHFYKVFSLGLPEVFFKISSFSLSEFVSSLLFTFGSNYGYGVFFLVLSFLGIYTHFSYKYKFLFFYVLLGILLFAGFYLKFILIYLNFVLAFFAGVGLMALFLHEWRSKVFRFLTIFVIFSGLLFNLITFFGNVNGLYPDSSYNEPIGFLASQQFDGVVFSDYKNGDLIAYSGKKNFLDTNLIYAPNVMLRYEDYKKILQSKNIDVSIELMNKYNIEYLLMDNRMKKAYFTDDEEGLLFLLKYSPLDFALDYENDNVEIWRRVYRDGNNLEA